MLLNGRVSIFYFINLIKFDIIAICLYALLAGVMDLYSFLKDVSVPLTISSLIGTLVSLVLAFRTAQSYERWWEARIVWGGIVNDSRTMIRQLQQFLPEGSEEVIRAYAERQAIWCFALSESLRKQPFSEKVRSYLEKHNIQATNIPNALLSKHAEDLAMIAKRYELNPNMQVQLDATLTKLTDAMGRCERIKNTIFPKSYSLLIHFLIYVFLSVFPFGLDDNHIIAEVFLTTLIPVLFIAIERTAIIMQDPFENRPTDTPMTALSHTIEINLCEMTGMEKPAPLPPPSKFYIM